MTKFILASGVFLAVATLGLTLSCGGERTSPITSTPTYSSIAPAEAAALLEQNRGNPNFIIIDVRTPAEFQEEIIAGAVNIDYNASGFQDAIARLDKSKAYFIYCRSANRSKGALEVMKKLGFQEVTELAGGINAWKAAGLPTIKP